MHLDLWLPLAGLALVDSTSFGTLLIPLWLMLAPGRLRPSRVVAFLVTVAGFYLLLGVALTLGAVALADEVSSALGSDVARTVQMVFGAALVLLGLTIEPWTKKGKQRRDAARAAREAERGPGRLSRWRQRAMASDGAVGAVVALALTAAVVEAGSMLPYLAAVGLVAAASPPLAVVVAVLAGYCLVMIAPALVLLAVRWVLQERLTRPLQRLEGWLRRGSGEALAWVLFLLGLILVVDAGEWGSA